MTERGTVEKAFADAGRNVRSRMREAVYDILDLVWSERSDKFAFADNPDVDAEVNRVLRELSDGFLEDARRDARNLLKSLEYDDWADESIADAEAEIDGETALFRFDMQASHLKELLEGWIVVAAVYGLSKWQVWTNLNAYIGNPMASELWRGAGRGALRWGRGYAHNIINDVRRLERDFLTNTFAYAKYHKAVNDGATYYIRHRGSNFICPWCDSYCEKKIPIENLIIHTHANCACWNEYFYE